MPAKNQQKSVLLFDRSGGAEETSHEDMWDDSELIAAWDRQLDLLKATTSTTRQPPPLADIGDDVDEDDVNSEEEEEEESGTESSSKADRGLEEDGSGGDDAVASRRGRQSRTTTALVQPRVPDGVSDEVRELLEAWYCAGVAAGKFMAARKRQREIEI